MLAQLYGKAEKNARGTENAYDLELLNNLWFMLQASVRSGNLAGATAKLDERTRTLNGELERLSAQDWKPSNALQARTLLLFMRLVSSLPGDVDPVLRELLAAIKQCEGLAGYPLEPFMEIVTDLGKLLGDRPAYGELLEAIVDLTSTRTGEVSAARVLLKRGAQQIDADRPYEAIQSLGRALTRLFKHESLDDLIRALYLCGGAYERVGLLWAARGTVLTAASLATDALWKYEEVTPFQAACYNRLKWLELRLGRLPQILAWHEMDSMVRNVLADMGYDRERLARGESDFDAILGMLLLRTEIWDLKWLSSLPDLLDKLGLQCSAVALQYSLGHEKDLPKELVGDNTGEALHSFFVQWRDQPAAQEIASAPSLYGQRVVTLVSNVLGCQIVAESENVKPCVALAESVLAATESLLSTGLPERLVAREPLLTMRFRKSDFVEAPFALEMQERDGRPHLEVQCAQFDDHMISREVHERLRDKMLEVLTHLLARVFMLGEPKHVLTKLFGDEVALERAINFTSSFVTLGNVLGDKPKTTLSAWASTGARDYPLTRSEEWDAAERRGKDAPAPAKERRLPAMGTGEPPAEVLDMMHRKHTELETISLIRELLWEKAGWHATAFFWSPDDSAPPTIALVFKDAEAAAAIFAQWKRELGTHDTAERLRVAIVRRMNRKAPHEYRVIIGANPTQAFSRPDVKTVFMLSRINTMMPSSDRNLENFLRSYRTHGVYALMHAVSTSDPGEPAPVWKNLIVKREVFVRDAWEIGEHDPDGVGIEEDDDPIIPPGQENAPVLGLLLRKRRAGK